MFSVKSLLSSKLVYSFALSQYHQVIGDIDGESRNCSKTTPRKELI